MCAREHTDVHLDGFVNESRGKERERDSIGPILLDEIDNNKKSIPKKSKQKKNKLLASKLNVYVQKNDLCCATITCVIESNRTEFQQKQRSKMPWWIVWEFCGRSSSLLPLLAFPRQLFLVLWCW